MKPEPSDVGGVDVVVDTCGLHLLAIVAGMRNALPVGAAVSVGWIAGCRGPVAVKGTAENRKGSILSVLNDCA